MDTAPTLGHTVFLAATVTEVHHADNSSPPEYRTALVSLADGQQVMTHWSNLRTGGELATDLVADAWPFGHHEDPPAEPSLAGGAPPVTAPDQEPPDTGLAGGL